MFVYLFNLLLFMFKKKGSQNLLIKILANRFNLLRL